MNPKPSTIHILPCTIEYSGEAKVSKYFQPGPNATSVSLRGRRLISNPIKLQDSHFSILHKDDQNNWKVDQKLEFVTEWHHDEVDKSLEDKLRSAADISLVAELFL